jgi:hypothetical protein
MRPSYSRENWIHAVVSLCRFTTKLPRDPTDKTAQDPDRIKPMWFGLKSATYIQPADFAAMNPSKILWFPDAKPLLLPSYTVRFPVLFTVLLHELADSASPAPRRSWETFGTSAPGFCRCLPLSTVKICTMRRRSTVVLLSCLPTPLVKSCKSLLYSDFRSWLLL